MCGLFGTSGVRGVLNEEVTPELGLKIALSFGSELGISKKVMIGRDTRFSGEMLESSILSGFLSVGCDVGKLGIVPTPVVGFSVGSSEASAGVMVTASHNPPEYNGIKLFDSDGKALSPEMEKSVERNYFDKNYDVGDWTEIGSAEENDFLSEYLDKMGEEVSLENEFKVIVDCANGPSSKTTPVLLRRMGCEVFTVNSQLDGSFPGRPPEPVEENLCQLGKLVRTMDADLGLAHDGDGDRIAAIDDKGRFVGQDKLLALMGGYYARKKGTGVVTTVDASKAIDESVSKAGEEVIRTKVGDVSVVEQMSSKGFEFGGEPSGTWILGDLHMCPDGTMAAARVLEMLDESEYTLSQLVDSVPAYPIKRDKVSCSDDKKREKMEVVESEAESLFENIKDVLTIDGVRLELEGGDWILIRPSGTEPYIRITSEAGSEDKAEEMVENARELLED